MEKIDKFSGKYKFLSNFFYHDRIFYNTLSSTAVEPLYQASKSLDILIRENISKMSSWEAKKEGEALKRQGLLREDWYDVNLKIMEDLLLRKFAIPELQIQLLATEDAELEEGNWWGDIFWGTCNGEGKNYLGILLMKVRKHYNDILIKKIDKEKN